MSLNCNELNLILNEINLEGFFIQEIIQPTFDTITFRAFSCGVSKTVLICTGAQSCRINLITKKVPKNEKPLRFNEFLKSRILGSRINSIKQLGLDRIVKIELGHHGENGDENFILYARLWSGAANVILTDTDGNILDCMFRRPKKNEVTGGFFKPEEKTLTEDDRKIAEEKFPIRNFADFNFNDSNNQKEQLSFNEKIEKYYSESASNLSRENLLEQAKKWYSVKKSKMISALQNLESKQKEFSNAEKLKHTGDLILAFGSEANGNSIDCIDYEDGKPVHIRIDSSKSIHENAQIYYNQYKKAVSGTEALAHDIQMAQNKLKELELEYQKIISQTNVLKMEQFLRHDTTPKQKIEKAHPGLHYEIDGWTIIVGRTANENDELLRHTVKGSDMWLHARDYAGGYVFVKCQKNKSIPLEILLYAGNLAIYHSKARKNGSADLYYTQVKYLRRAKNGPKGLVIPTQEKNLFCKIDEAKLRRLDEYEKSAESI